MNNLKTQKEYEEIEISKNFYHENNLMNSLFYSKINDLFPFIFKNKVSEFYIKSEPYFKDQELKYSIHRKKIIMAIATENYTVNHFNHFYFNIDGIEYVYGVVSIHSLFEEANEIKNKIQQEKLIKKDQPSKSNILHFVKKDNK